MTRLFHLKSPPWPSGSPGLTRHRPALWGAYEGSANRSRVSAGASSHPAPPSCVVSPTGQPVPAVSLSLIPQGTDGGDPGVPSSNTSLRRVQ